MGGTFAIRRGGRLRKVIVAVARWDEVTTEIRA